MTPERWKEIEAVYWAARGCTPSERGAYIEKACGDDRDLRIEVESLLAHDDSSPEVFLNRPAASAFADLECTITQRGAGTRLGPYQIESVLGAGGMGEVFRGRDTRLNRPVAIKVPRAQFSDRFEREARAISSLNHPHICTLYDVGPDYLVMELLEGETLADRLKKGPLPMDAVVQYGQQMASALTAAHAKGLVHRDLKPGNIMITKAGVKILDFGLAKATRDETLTHAQAVIGTPAYMSPEQREGKTCDYRTDVYSLGLILREMLSGKRGAPSSAAETPQFTQLVDRCLCEAPEDRWQSASDLGYVLASSGTQSLNSAPLQTSARSWPFRLAAAAVLVVLAAVLWTRIPPRSATPSAVRLALTLPTDGSGVAFEPGSPAGPPVISPDGKTVVVSLMSKGESSLWMRRLESEFFERIDGTEEGVQPFWSPDGTRIGFFTKGKLKKVKLPHGAPETLCDIPSEASRGGAWGSKGTILFGINFKGLMKVSENGGDPVPVTTLDGRLKENSHRFPQFHPDGNRFIYYSRSLDAHNHAVYLDALDTTGKAPRKHLALADGPSALGHDPSSDRDLLVYPRDGRLWAQQLNLNSASLQGEKTAISDDVGYFSVSATGTLVFRRASAQQTTLTWFNREGKAVGQAGQPGEYLDVALSPDERFAAVLSHRSREGRFWIEMMDLARNVQNSFSDPAARASGMVWSNDSRSLYFTLWGEQESQIVLRHVDSASAEQPLLTSSQKYEIRSLTPDGKTFAADRFIGSQQGGLAFLNDGRPPWKLYGSPSDRLVSGQFSPNGKWLIYQSLDTGVPEIYVSDFPGLNIRRRISVAGGSDPRWRRDGKEVLYVAPQGSIMSAPVENAEKLTFAKPSALFQFPGHVWAAGSFSYDVARDGKRFLVITPTAPINAHDLTLVINWPQLISAEAAH